MDAKQVIIIGGGPAGLMAAEILSFKHHVSIYEKEKNVGQKFLLAGKGGFNLTNHLQGEAFKDKYSPAGFMNQALSVFDASKLRQWLSDLGIPTFSGTSGRIFPQQGIKPIDILNKIRTKLANQGVQFYTQHECIGFDEQRHVSFRTNGTEKVLAADYIIFALGGASWPVTGSNGLWRQIFESMDIATLPFQPSNCGVIISWPASFKSSHAGKPIKNISLTVNSFKTTGEMLITDSGLEGNAIYPLVPSIRDMLQSGLPAILTIDFKPLNSVEQLLKKLEGKFIKAKDYGKLFNLDTAQLALIKAYTNKDSFLIAHDFVHHLKKLKIPVISLKPAVEAISTIGGISLQELNDDFSLKKYPWIFTIGEMVDWDAPTGGFLLQGCFSMGNYAAQSIMRSE